MFPELRIRDFLRFFHWTSNTSSSFQKICLRRKSLTYTIVCDYETHAISFQSRRFLHSYSFVHERSNSSRTNTFVQIFTPFSAYTIHTLFVLEVHVKRTNLLRIAGIVAIPLQYVTAIGSTSLYTHCTNCVTSLHAWRIFCGLQPATYCRIHCPVLQKRMSYSIW